MPSWTPDKHAEARVWANERGAKSRALGEALDEIERLRDEHGECTSEGEPPKDLLPFPKLFAERVHAIHCGKAPGNEDCIDMLEAIAGDEPEYPPRLMWAGGQRPEEG